MTAPAPAAATTLTERRTGTVLLVCGLLGAAASFVLVLERLAVLADPFYVPSCTLDAVVRCGAVITSPQSQLFGFPNPLLGLVAFPVVATVGVAARSGASRTLWLGLQAGALAGLVLVHWLIWQSLYVIGALCPYCILVWVVTGLVFWYTTLHAVGAGLLPLPGPLRAAMAGAGALHSAVPAAWLCLVAVLVVLRFAGTWAAS